MYLDRDAGLRVSANLCLTGDAGELPNAIRDFHG